VHYYYYLLGARKNLGGQLKESFLERMRSRAEPDATCAPPTPPRPDREYYSFGCARSLQH